MSELSIFIDESGDFGEVKERPAYYLVTMVFHNQAVDISIEIEKLEEVLLSLTQISAAPYSCPKYSSLVPS